MTPERAKQQFQENTANHTLNIIKDDGVHRHLSFTNNGSSCYRFDLITWPGHLCITGDVETYVFQRVEDMFSFFKGSNEYGINPRYWAEKIINAGDSKWEKHSPELFEANVREWTDQWEFEDEGLKADVLNAVETEVLSCAEDEHAAYRAAFDFDDYLDEGYGFEDFFETSSKEYSFGYLWSCFAIVRGIEMYQATATDQPTNEEPA